MARLTRRTWRLIRCLAVEHPDARSLQPALQRRRFFGPFGQARFERFGPAAEPVDAADQRAAPAGELVEAHCRASSAVFGEPFGAGGELLAAAL